MRWSSEKHSDSEMGGGRWFNAGKRLRTVFWLGCLLALSAKGSFGYVIDGAKIIELTAQQLGRTTTLQVNQRLTSYRFDQETRQSAAGQVVSYIFPHTFRADLTADNMRRSFLAQNDRSLAIVNGRIDPAAESEPDLYHYLLLHRSGNEISRFLTAYGIDIAVSSLGKFEKKVAYVIGVQYPDEDNSQLWIDKESLLPMRWILVSISTAGLSQARPAQAVQPESDSAESEQVEPDQVEPEPVLEHLEFRFSLWRKFDRLQYPMRVDILRDGVLLREVRVDNVKENPDLDEALMNIDKQKALFPQAEDNREELQEEESPDDLQQTIDNFKKKFE